MNSIKSLSIKKKIIFTAAILVYLVFAFYFFRKFLVDRSVGMLIRRVFYTFLVLAFFELHVFYDIRKLYEFIFDHRLIIAVCVFAFLVANNLNFSSLAEFSNYIQPGEGSAYCQPVFGIPRIIRSDEWMVNISRMLSGSYSHFGPVNDLLRGTTADNLSASWYQYGYWIFMTPAAWGYYLFGASYGLSFYWSFMVVFGFLAAFELIYILTGRRAFALLGAVLIQFSGFNLWWSNVTPLMAGNSAIVLFYYFVKERKLLKKSIIGFFMAAMLGAFVVYLYPAWQVTFGYVFLAILIWMIIKEKDEIKSFRPAEWLITAACMLFFATSTLSYIIQIRPYMNAAMSTSYPGHRRMTGGFSLNLLFGYLSSAVDAVNQRANPCEPAMFFMMFPLGHILSVYLLAKKKGRDTFIWLMYIPTALLLWYCGTGMPEGLAVVTLMSYSTPARAVDALGYICLILLFYCLSQMDKYRLPQYVSLPLTVIVFIPALVSSFKEADFNALNYFMIIVIAIVGTLVVSYLMSGKKYTISLRMIAASSALLLALGLLVHPVMVGLDAILSKPAAQEVASIVKKDKNAKWIGCGNIVIPNFLVSCGASTYNSVNYIPNMDFWKKLDPDGKYKDMYNRYAHIQINLTDNNTNLSLPQADLLVLDLSYKDLPKIGVDYIMSNTELDNSQLEEIYYNQEIRIYHVR